MDGTEKILSKSVRVECLMLNAGQTADTIDFLGNESQHISQLASKTLAMSAP